MWSARARRWPPEYVKLVNKFVRDIRDANIRACGAMANDHTNETIYAHGQAIISSGHRGGEGGASTTTGDDHRTSADALEALVGICPLIYQFKKKVLDWKPDGKNPPTTVEHFKMMTSAELMVFHLAQIDGLREAAESMQFVKSFDEQIKPLDKSLNTLLKACKEVVASERLPKILQYGECNIFFDCWLLFGMFVWDVCLGCLFGMFVWDVVSLLPS